MAITNYLSPISFKIVIERLPNVEFFTQNVAIPGLSMTPAPQVSPLHQLYETGDRIDYADLDLSFIADENMNNYQEILRWMEGLGTPEESKQRFDIKKTKAGERSDITIIVENSTRNANLEFVFTDAFPTALGGVQLDVTSTDVQYPVITVSFRYNNMRFRQL